MTVQHSGKDTPYICDTSESLWHCWVSRAGCSSCIPAKHGFRPHRSLDLVEIYKMSSWTCV